MGIFSDYLSKKMTFQELTNERKKQLKEISRLRGNRDIIVYASDLSNRSNSPISIDFTDILPFQDQLSNLNGQAIDVIIETPGGIAEAVEDIVKLLRSKYEHIGVIVPGTAKSAGTIFTMAGDEILMGEASALGPIDAQIINGNKRFSADAFLEGLEKIKSEVQTSGRLNPAYIPILQNISPGEIKHYENAQALSRTLVKEWLTKYKFKYWENHTSSGKPVTLEEKEKRAEEIATILCSQSDWLTHGRSIHIADLQKMGLIIEDYTNKKQLNEAIIRYYTLLKMTFESTNVYKLFETINTQIQRFAVPNNVAGLPGNNLSPLGKTKIENVMADINCPKCHQNIPLFAKTTPGDQKHPGKIQFPKNNHLICPNCKFVINVSQLRLQIESQTGLKIID